MRSATILIPVTAAATALLCLPVLWLLRRVGVLDCPNDRSSHSRPTVRGGGVAVVIVVVAGGLTLGGAQAWNVRLALCAVVAVAALSFADDLWSVPAYVRFIWQTACACVAVAAVAPGSPTLTAGPFFSFTIPIALGTAAEVLWVVGYTNAFNFMDGINGLAAGQALIAGAGTGLLVGQCNPHGGAAPLAYAVAGAALGFLPYNFPRARAFMGDVGSASLGFVLSVLALAAAKECGWAVFLPVIALHANFVLDTGLTLVRRTVHRQPVWRAHRDHFYQRMIRLGASHVVVTTTLCVCEVVVLGAMLRFEALNPARRVGVLLMCVALWLTVFGVIERRFRTAAAEVRGEGTL